MDTRGGWREGKGKERRKDLTKLVKARAEFQGRCDQSSPPPQLPRQQQAGDWGEVVVERKRTTDVSDYADVSVCSN